MVWTCRENVTEKIVKKYASLVTKEETRGRGRLPKMRNIRKECYERERFKGGRLRR